MTENNILTLPLIFPLIALLAPFLLVLYLFGTKFSLTIVNKKILNNGLIVTNCISLLMFCISLFMPVNFEKIFFSFENVSIRFGILTDYTNIKFLVLCASIFILFGIYLKNYFSKKTQFYFVKQRFYALLSLLICCVYLFLLSSNLFQSLILLMLCGLLVFAFSYFDIFRINANLNIQRFHRIYLIGDISYLAFILILFKHVSISAAYANMSGLNFSHIPALIEYLKGVMPQNEYITGIICLLVAVSSRLCLFPLNCFYSFFSNVSNMLFCSVVFGLNAILGSYILIRLYPYLLYGDTVVKNCIIFASVSALISLLSLFFEKKIKIIFGYLISALNAFLLFSVLKYNNIDIIICSYFVMNFILMFILMKFFTKDKVNIKSIIKKQKGFLIERAHIFIFEDLTHKIAVVLKFIDEKIVQNVLNSIIYLINSFISLLDFKPSKKDVLTNIWIILTIVSIFAFFAIFIVLFAKTWEA